MQKYIGFYLKYQILFASLQSENKKRILIFKNNQYEKNQ